MHLDEQKRADDLLQGSLKTIEELPRLGNDGYWITDVRVYALQNRKDRALETFRHAVDEGWRVLTWYYLRTDPNLDSIRNEPEFQRLRDVVEEDLSLQAKRMQELEASGELAAITSVP